MTESPEAIIPELSLLGGAVAGLLLGMFLPRWRQGWVAVVAVAALLAGIAAAAYDLPRPARMVFDEYAVDRVLGAGRLVVLAATLLALLMSRESVRGARREAEYYVLFLLGALGAVALAGAGDLLLLVAAYLLASVPLYALAGFAKDAHGTEAALKYYLMGALLGIVLLAGVTVLFAAGGGTSYAVLAGSLRAAPRGMVVAGAIAVLGGLAFKAGAVPGHFWVPDVAEGTPPPVAAYVTTIPKIGGLLAVYRLFAVVLERAPIEWSLLLAVVAAATMTLGNLAAFFQDDARRLLAYSSISQVGYLLMAAAVAGRTGLAQEGLLLYVAAYAVTNIGAFAVVASLPPAARLRDFAGLFHRRPLLALSLVTCLLAFVGTPPTGVFAGKLVVFSAAIDGGLAWLAVLAVVNSVASVFYYLRWVAPLFLRGPDASVAPVRRPGAAATAYASALLALATGPAAGLALTLAGTAPLGR